VPFILDKVYENLENDINFSPNLPGYTSDVYTPMSRETLEEDFLSKFDVESFDVMIADNNLVEQMVGSVNKESQEKYSQILENADWQGPFFYGGSGKDTFGYFSFATITPSGDFGGWWMVFWKNGTIRLNQNLTVSQVGKCVTKN
jgi:hypothetical protein